MSKLQEMSVEIYNTDQNDYISYSSLFYWGSIPYSYIKKWPYFQIESDPENMKVLRMLYSNYKNIHYFPKSKG